MLVTHNMPAMCMTCLQHTICHQCSWHARNTQHASNVHDMLATHDMPAMFMTCLQHTTCLQCAWLACNEQDIMRRSIPFERFKYRLHTSYPTITTLRHIMTWCSNHQCMTIAVTTIEIVPPLSLEVLCTQVSSVHTCSASENMPHSIRIAHVNLTY